MDFIDIVELSGIMSVNDTIQNLDLSSCGITYDGAYQLSNGLRGNRSLTRLGVRENSFGCAGAILLRLMFTENKTLLALYPPSSEDPVQLSINLEIDQCLHLNRMMLWTWMHVVVAIAFARANREGDGVIRYSILPLLRPVALMAFTSDQFNVEMYNERIVKLDAFTRTKFFSYRIGLSLPSVGGHADRKHE